MDRPVYLDWNATTPLHPDVVAAMNEANAVAWANPASVHSAGRAARARVEDCREAIAGVLEVHPRDVLFTSGGTEANNLALYDAPGIATSRIEHPSVVRAAEACERAGRPVVWLPVPENGRIAPEAVEEALTRLPPGSWVALMAVNHETGVIQPVQEVLGVVRDAGARLHVDAVQAVGKLEPALFRGADRIALAAHKIRGPKGIGALGWREGRAPKPILLGGSQERGLRPGTVSAVAAQGFLAALRWAERAPVRYAALAALRDELERRLGSYAAVNGAGVPRVPHVTNLSFGEVRGDELVAALDLLGVQVSSGSACSAGTAEPSAVITAMLGPERALGAIRISLGDDTASQDVERAILAVFQALGAREHQLSSDG
jgi:cysteine desulfurase